MELQYSQVIEILAERHNIAPGSLVAFKARLKHFQKLGFPEGVNTGKGKRASYGWDELIQLGAALELLELGLTPEKAVTAITELRITLLAKIASFVCANKPPKVAHHTETCFLIARPLALATLRADTTSHPVVLIVNALDLMGMSDANIHDNLWSSFSVINISQLLSDLVNLISKYTKSTQPDLKENLYSWADGKKR